MIPEPRVTFTLPGVAYYVARDGNWPTDCPRGWADLSTGRVERRGFGFRVHAELIVADAENLAAYLESVAEVEADMTSAERQGSKDGRAAARGAEIIRAELNPTPAEPERFYVAATGFGWGVYDRTKVVPVGVEGSHPSFSGRVEYISPSFMEGGSEANTFQDAEREARRLAAELNAGVEA